MKYVIIIMALLLMTSFAVGQQFDHNTRLAIGIGMQDVYDAVRGYSNIGSVLKVAPIIPIIGTDSIKSSNRLTQAAYDTYLIPYITGGYYDDQWEGNVGGSIAYDFGSFYIRYNMQLAELAQGEKPNSNIGHGVGFGIDFPKIWAEKIDNWTGIGFFKNTKIDMQWMNDKGESTTQTKEGWNITFVKIL